MIVPALIDSLPLLAGLGVFVLLLTALLGRWTERAARAREDDSPSEAAERRARAWFRYQLLAPWIRVVLVIGGFAATSKVFASARLDDARGLMTMTTFLLGAALAYLAMVALVARVAAPTLLALGVRSTTPAAIVREMTIRNASMVAFVVAGCSCFFGMVAGHPRFAVTCLVAGFVVGFGLWRSHARGSGFELESLRSGELHDAILDLASRAGAEVREIFVVRSFPGETANAMAVTGQRILLSERLVNGMTKRQTLAIVAHELAHLRARDPRRLGRNAGFGLLLGIAMWVAIEIVARALGASQSDGLAGRIFPEGSPSATVGIVTIWIFFLGIFTLRSRGIETRTDDDATRLTGDPEALITALARLTRQNVMPSALGRYRIFSTHPDLEARAAAIAEAHDITPEHVRGLLDDDHPVEGEPRFVLDVDRVDRVFTTPFRHRAIQRAFFFRLATTALFAALLARALRAFHSPWQLAAIAAGAVATVVFSVMLADRMSIPRRRTLEAKLRKKLAGETIDLSRGHFIGMAPDASLRYYDSYAMWDIGFWWLEAGRLVFIGDQARFHVDRADVLGAAVVRGEPSWLFRRQVAVSVRDGESTATIQLVPMVDSAWASRRVARELVRIIEAWRRGHDQETPARADAPPPFRPLEVASAPPWIAASMLEIVVGGFLATVFGVAAALFVGLGAAGTAFVVVATVMAFEILLVPAWISRFTS